MSKLNFGKEKKNSPYGENTC